MRDLIREICPGRTTSRSCPCSVRPDHVHLLVSMLPHLAPSRVMQAVKGQTSRHLLQGPTQAAGGVLESAPVGSRLFRVHQRQRHGRGRFTIIYTAPRCRAPGRRPLSSQRVSEPACAATATFSRLQSTHESLAFRRGPFNLYRKPLTGPGAETLLLATPDLKPPSDWSRDGRILLYTTFDLKTGGNLEPSTRGRFSR